MSYTSLGSPEDPNSSDWQGPICPDGTLQMWGADYTANGMCHLNEGGYAVQSYPYTEDTTQPGVWVVRKVCPQGGKVTVRNSCAPINSPTGRTVGATYTPPSWKPPTPPPVTVRCPNGPPQPAGRCCPEGQIGVAPACVSVNPSPPVIRAPRNTSSSPPVQSSGPTGGGRPPPPGAQQGMDLTFLSRFLSSRQQPSTTLYYIPTDAPSAHPASSGGASTVVDPRIFSVPSTARPSPVATSDGSAAHPPSAMSPWILAAIFGTAVLAVGGLGYVLYESRQ